MTKLIALDVAILPPPDVAARAVALGAALPFEASERRLDDEHLPHITLTQQFVREEEMDLAFEHIDGVLRDAAPMRLTATGCAKEGHTIWMAIERTPELSALHERLMEALRGVERQEGTPAAFVDHDGRLADVLWVTGYRLKSSFGAFAPHITLGHGSEAPAIEPFTFEAATIAACHLGRHCTCRRVLRQWRLGGDSGL
jgi:2'-5' RNA ligase